MIAIHENTGYTQQWIEYCKTNNIPFRLVNCHDNDVIDQLRKFDALLWHVDHVNYKDFIMSRHLITSLKNLPIKVYPDFDTMWHFDDKLAQKYLLESIDAPHAQAYVFYDYETARKWIQNAPFPLVFKLRKGSSSKNVRLIRSKVEARKLAYQAFNKGFEVRNFRSGFLERIRKYKQGKESFKGVIKGFVRMFLKTPYVKMTPREKGYIYFQEFLPNNDSDHRVIFVANRVFAHKRFVRKNDFRASGSGNSDFDPNNIDMRCVKISFEVAKKLGLQSAAFDFVFDEENNPKIIELSYAFSPEPNRNVHPGYWDENLNWHKEDCDFEAWMIEDLITKTNTLQIDQ